MIVSIIYGESCQGTLNYVFGKEGMRILGYGNMCSQDISQKFFGSVLHFQGQRNATKNRYAHISLNLPHGEHLDDKTFHKVSKEYLEKMGYGEQPYVIVRHNDTKHEHVHIVTTNVNETGKVLSIFNSYRRSIAARQYLEKKFGLSPAPSTKQERNLPLYRLPELQSGLDETQGAKFYLQDVLNGILQKHKVRSFQELAKLVEPYHIEIRQTKSESGRVGVAYGLNNQKGYQTRFINGSIVHRGLSGPKLQKVFDAESKTKLLPMHRKRLLKQIETTFGLFKTIRPHDLAKVLKEYQNVDIKLDEKGDTIYGYTIYDKSGYVFRERELSHNIRMVERPDIFGNRDEQTEIDSDSKQYKLEVQKLIKEAFQASYLKPPKQNRLLSESILTKNLDNILPYITQTKNHIFLEHYLPKNQKELLYKVLEKEFPSVKERLYKQETKKEKETLEGKFQLIGKVLGNGIFNVGKENGSVRLLFQSLGVKYHNNLLSFTNSNKHKIPVNLGELPFPKAMENYVSTGFIRQNHLMLEMLTSQQSDSGLKMMDLSVFLPMIFPKLYQAMAPSYRQQYENVALGSYLKHAEWMHAPFEKSAKDYIGFFNAKGFYFVKGNEGLAFKSIYTDNRTSFALPERTSLYLNSIPNLSMTLKEQESLINALVKDGRNDLKNLWAGYLMERGLYGKVSYMLREENIYPNLHPEMVHHHMDSGLRKSIKQVMERKAGHEQNRLLSKGVYVISSLLGSRGKGQEEVYNGFKDELTDYSKFKGKGFSL
ncbi:relaxase/mobilization nuclease domain-containing protein [Maribacter sp. ACAM166]|uniref:relaxase/mobilization nuclease domain-containing protein n=1 Tax=Maribacter sp. ACAM166 TaxID=2508996 RepID=UPI0010FE7AA6|nr:relaxase/mobilization nuclease domain-containing protein [Maribacter sp. ACAM166]TLP74374.1 hypothetical protein ES765_16020 [Maribacter sp. ACAM166]